MDETAAQRAKKNRKIRMVAARKRGTHTKAEWEALKAEFDNHCVRCWTSEYPVEKDHITPICQGGSDSIANIQPLCARCNARKGPESINWMTYHRSKRAGVTNG